jgi:hypothetical protein
VLFPKAFPQIGLRLHLHLCHEKNPTQSEGKPSGKNAGKHEPIHKISDASNKNKDDKVASNKNNPRIWTPRFRTNFALEKILSFKKLKNVDHKKKHINVKTMINHPPVISIFKKVVFLPFPGKWVPSGKRLHNYGKSPCY